MALVEIALGVALSVFLIALVFGLLTDKIPWRVSGCCCPADPSMDRRMSTPDINLSVPSNDEPSPSRGA